MTAGARFGRRPAMARWGRHQSLLVSELGGGIHPIVMLAGYALAGQVALLVAAAAAIVPVEPQR